MAGAEGQAGGTRGSIAARLDGDVTLAGYRDFEIVARGGDSVVYRARQEGLGRDVAVKVVRLDEPAAIAGFRRELEITVRLGRQHPNIVTVHDTGVLSTGEPCLVMEYYDRGSLHDQLRAHGRLPVAETVAVGMVIADALAFAHGQGVLHRDVKPQNILVLPTSYVLADFGIARRVDAEHSASLERYSYRHASPQVLDGEPPSAADDLYSLGSTLYTLLDGRPPFAAEGEDSDTALAYLRRVRTAPPRPLDRPDVPAGLVEIIIRCLARERAERFPDAAALRQALAALPAGLTPPATPPATPTPTAIPTPTSTAIPTPPPTAIPAPPATAASPAAPTPATVDPAPDPALDAAADLAPDPAADPWAPPPGWAPGAPSAKPVPRPQAPDSGEPKPAAVDPGEPAVSPPAAPRAVSALAHLTDAPPEPAVSNAGHYDTYAEPTGAPPIPTSEPAESAPPPSRPGWRRLAVLAAAAVVVGALIGVGNALLGDRSDPGGAGSTATGGIPTFTGTLPAQTGPPQVDVGDPKLAPEITGLEDRSTSVLLRWTDPSDGEATFVVTLRSGKGVEPVAQVRSGKVEFLVEGLDPAATQYCFQIVALVDGGARRGVSQEQCTPTRSG